MRVRWALEEVGQAYDVRLLTFKEMKEPANLALHPFGQIPTYEEGDLTLFESGAIVLHIAERHAGLLPGDANARAWWRSSKADPSIMTTAGADQTQLPRNRRRSAARAVAFDAVEFPRFC